MSSVRTSPFSGLTGSLTHQDPEEHPFSGPNATHPSADPTSQRLWKPLAWAVSRAPLSQISQGSWPGSAPLRLGVRVPLHAQKSCFIAQAYVFLLPVTQPLSPPQAPPDHCPSASISGHWPKRWEWGEHLLRPGAGPCSGGALKAWRSLRWNAGGIKGHSRAGVSRRGRTDLSGPGGQEWEPHPHRGPRTEPVGPTVTTPSLCPRYQRALCFRPPPVTWG